MTPLSLLARRTRLRASTLPDTDGVLQSHTAARGVNERTRVTVRPTLSTSRSRHGVLCQESDIGLVGQVVDGAPRRQRS